MMCKSVDDHLSRSPARCNCQRRNKQHIFFVLVVIFSVLIYVDLHFKVRTFGYWLADDKFSKKAIDLALTDATFCWECSQIK